MASASGRKRFMSTPPSHSRTFLKPCASSSRFIAGVRAITETPALWNQRSSDQIHRSGMKGKRAWTYSGKRVWKEVVNSMPCSMQMARALIPIVPSVAMCTASGANSRMIFSSPLRGKMASRISG